ncbi:DUF2147 domain-containing protein [Stakelama sediminis]|nr:DUF2147 domain-containing protein [Stakelama sediminis]
MRFRALMVAAATAMLPAAAFAAQPVTGKWKTEDGKAIVTIGHCGSQICGKITQILKSDRGPNPKDTNNPDPKLRDRPLEGLMILTGFSEDGDEWKGRIYSPEEGKTYRSILERDGQNGLKVKGCIAFFCKTQHWTAAG